jgi:hypothetical protein
MARTVARVWWGSTLLDVTTALDAAPTPGLRVELINADQPDTRTPRRPGAWRDLMLPALVVACFVSAFFTPLALEARPHGAWRFGRRDALGPLSQTVRFSDARAPVNQRESLLRELARAAQHPRPSVPVKPRPKVLPDAPLQVGDTVGITGIGTVARDGRVGPYGKRAESEPVLMGPLDPEDIRRVVRAHLREVRACFDASVTRGESLSNRFSVRFTIGPRGSITEASTRGGAPLLVDRCVTSAIRSWKFPAPRGGGVVVVNYPFTS